MNKKEKNIYKYFLKMLLIFIGLDFLMMITSSILASSSLFAKYGVDLITEIYYAFAILIVMLLFHNAYVFTERKKKFWKSVCLGLPMLVISIINFVINITSLKSFSVENFVNVLILCVFVGIAEEFLCRGWLQNEFMERFSDDKKSVIKSIVLASLVFGVMHIINVSSQTLFETILQIINATAIGMLLGSIYYKTKNIWSVIFLHAFYDFSIFLGEMNLVKDCTFGTPTLGVTIVNCVGITFISILWIASALKVLNTGTIKGEKTDKKKDLIYSTIIIISLIFVFVPFEKLVPNYDDYETCYEYAEIDSFNNYEEHFPHYETYYIESNVETNRFEENGFSNNLKEIKKDEEVLIEFKLNPNDTVNVKNQNTTYEVKLDIEHIDNIEIIENEDNYIIVIEAVENESTIYYSLINKDDMTNGKDFIDFIAGSFTKFALPQLSQVGYVTIENTEVKYPYLISENNDRFIIRNDRLFLIK